MTTKVIELNINLKSYHNYYLNYFEKYFIHKCYETVNEEE